MRRKNRRHIVPRSWAQVAALYCAALLAVFPAFADFDNDGFEDLVSNSPYKTVSGQNRAGLVLEVDGGAWGITTTDRLWHQDAGLAEVAEVNDYFGRTLAIGDFDGDGYHDLAVGVLFEDLSGLVNAGVVHIIYGTSTGLSANGDQLFDQEDATSATTVEADDRFGFSLAAGDFNGDGYDDLAVGSPTEDINADVDAGVVIVMYGSSSGLTGSGSQWIDQADVDGTVEEGDYFGHALVAGDFDGDGYADLAIGATGEDLGGFENAGCVNVVYGSTSGLYASSFDDLWHQNRAGIAGNCEADDRFGATLAAADFDGDGKDDLVIGVPGEDVETGGDFEDAGMIHVIYGTTFGLSSGGSQLMYQNNFHTTWTASEDGDGFGASLAAADFNGDGYADLVVGTPKEDWNSDVDAGVIQFIPGTSGGLDPAAADGFTEDDLLNGAAINGGEQFGYALAAGDINNDGYNDLAIGTPFEDLSGSADAGTVFVIYGQASGFSMDNDYFDHCTSGYEGDCDPGDSFGMALAAVPRKTTVGGDAIFSNGFESGTASAWSSIVP
jgi:hypothetical protein